MPDRTYEFVQLDVFTQTPLTGNFDGVSANANVRDTPKHLVCSNPWALRPPQRRLRDNRQSQVISVAAFVVGLEGVVADRDCPAVGKIVEGS
jgi:hypothetical protein